MDRQEMKANYHKFLASYRYMYSDEETMSKPDIKKRYDEVFEELMDTSRKSIGRLNEYQTEEVRRAIGVYAEEEGFEEPSLLVSLNSSAAAAITTRIKHGYIVVKDALLSGKLTYKQLLKLKLIEIDYPLGDANHVWLLHENGCVTVRDFIEYRFFGLTKDESLIDYMHSLGLILKGENIDLETAKKIKELMSEFEEITKKVNNCKSNTEEVTEIQKLQARKQKLLDKMQNLADPSLAERMARYKILGIR